MFTTARMQKLSIVTLDKYAKDTINLLHEKGVVQIEDISENIQEKEEFEGLEPSKQDPVASKLASLSMKASSIIDTLESAEKSTGIVDVIKGYISPKIIDGKEVEETDSETLVDKASEIIEKVESVTNPIEARMNEIGSEKAKYNDSLKIATELKSFDIDFGDLQDTKYTHVICGKLPEENMTKAENAISEITEKAELIKSTVTSEDGSKPIMIICSVEFEESISGVLRRLELEKLDINGLSGNPEEIITNSSEKLTALEKEKEECYKDLREISQRSKEALLIINEELEIEKEKIEIFSHFGQTNSTKMFEAWIPKNNVDQTLSLIDEVTDGHSVIEVTNPNDEEIDNNKVPVKQENPKFAKPYELIVNMYSVLNYKDIDPTIIMALFFPFFFGYCLTDAFYGIILAIVGLILNSGMGKINKTMKSFGIILTMCGLWTVVLGLVTNGFIGDFIPRFFMGDSSLQLATVINDINAFAHPENILIIALILGLIHLNIGFIFGIIDNLKRNNIKDMCAEQLPWMMIELSIILYLVTGSILVFGVIFVLALIILIYGAGLFGVMDIFGFLGNVLSYSRLLALCLSTGGIAMTVNILTQLSADMIPFIGIILAPIIFLGGHIFNLCFQSMGAFIHSLRLHYVEFFGGFYKGESEEFEPFKAERKYTKIRR